MYVDVLFIENFIINFLILSITSKFSKYKTTRTKLLIGSAVGALYIIFAFFPTFKIFFSLSMKIAVSVLMIIIVFAPEKFQHFFKLLGIFYVISFAFGGAAFALFYFTGRGNVINGTFYIRDFPLSLLISAFAVVYLLLSYCWGYIQKKILSDELVYNVHIELYEKTVEVIAIIDTGNSLKDPITDTPVIVVEYGALKVLLPDSLSSIFEKSDGDIDLTNLYNLSGDTNLVLKIRLIPFTSLGRQNGILVGIKPDRVLLNNKDGSKEIRDVIIGIYNNRVSKDGHYSALLYPEILI